MMRVVRSSLVSTWKRPPGVVSMLRPPRDHWMCSASPEKAQATVRTLPGSMLMSSGRASILGAEPGNQNSRVRWFCRWRARASVVHQRCFSNSPIALKEDPSRREDASPRLLELTAKLSEAAEDMLDMDIVSNFISAAMLLLKELDSIMDDLMCWTEEEAKEEEDSDTLCISFLIMVDEVMAAEDSLCVITADPDEERRGKKECQNFRVEDDDLWVTSSPFRTSCFSQ